MARCKACWWLGGLALGLLLTAPMAANAQEKGKPLPGLPIPDLEKLLPPGTIDPERLKQLKQLLEGQDQEFRKLMEDLQKQFPGGFPGGGQMLPPNMQLPAFGMASVERENRLGASLQKPSRVLAEQLDLPEKHGVVLDQVRPNSAAAKAGLKANDILLELNGKAVPSNIAEFVKQLNEIKKDTPVDAVVMRKGKRETVKGLKLGDVPANNNPFGNLPNLPNIQIQRLQGAQGLIGPAGTAMSTTRGADGSFTTKYKEGQVAITVQGKMEDNKANVANIEIRDGDQTSTYKSVSDVPEDLREDVRALIRAIESGKVTNRIKIGGQ